MGTLHDRESWALQLSTIIVNELETWLADEQFSLEHRAWFTEGRSGSPVALAVRGYPKSDQVVLKFFDAGSAPKVSNISQGWNSSKSFRKHLAKAESQIVRLKDWRATFLRVAGGNTATMRPLTAYSEAAELPDYCRTIVRSVLWDWNKGPLTTEHGTVAGVIRNAMGRRQKDVESWATDASIPLDGTPHILSRSGWPEQLRNPFMFVTGAEGERTVKDLIVGRAHGDLSGRNILVPTEPSVVADSYVLIDYDRFHERAPLARDPMHLLVALTLDRFNFFAPLRFELARVLVDPNTPDVSTYLEPIRNISTAIRTASAPKAKTGLGEQWTQQCLLSLVGAGLVHLGRELVADDLLVAKDWCLYLAALAAEAYLQRVPSLDRVKVVTAAKSSTGADGNESRMIDRDRERNGLRTRLSDGPGGVAVLRGTRGVGKTTLVNAVLNEMDRETIGGPLPRIRRHDVHAAQLDVRTLIDHVEGDADLTNPYRHSGSSLVRLEVALRRLGESRVVVAIDSAQNLLEPGTRKLVDRDLDEALELLATDPEHRVTVLMVTQDEPISLAGGTWPTAEEPIFVDKLRYPHFIAHLASLDRNGSLGLANLPEESRQALHTKVRGNPRLAELVYAVIVVAESGFNLHTLTDVLRTQDTKDVPTYLTRLLIDGLSPLRRSVLEALAAFGTPVPETAVVSLLKGQPQEKVGQALSVLAAHQVVYRTEHDQYFLPPEDGCLILDQISDDAERSRLFFSAATQLTFLQNSAPREVADLRVHFAELKALLRAKEFPSAYSMIEYLDDEILHKWNCSHLLLEQRKEVKGLLRSSHLEMANENALGGVYVSRGDPDDLDKADRAYGKALRIAHARHDDISQLKIYTNLAAMYWEQGDTGRALAYFEYARDKAGLLGNLPVRIGALEGIADCHRRHGHYDQAIQCANDALAVPRLSDYPDTDRAQNIATSRSVTVALKLGRWYGELARTDDAARLIEEAHAVAEKTHDAWLQASYLDGRADMLFDRGEFDEAEPVALAAEEQALQVRDRITLLQARTTLCLIYLKTDRIMQAHRAIRRAWHYRRTNRSLVVLALLALTTRQKGDRLEADRLFRQLFAETTMRIELDEHDFAAWDFHGFAICGTHLDTQDDLDEAVSALRFARSLTSPAPVLVARLRFMVEQLDRQDRLRSAIDALSDPR